jgi:hypothetical protein
MASKIHRSGPSPADDVSAALTTGDELGMTTLQTTTTTTTMKRDMAISAFPPVGEEESACTHLRANARTERSLPDERLEHTHLVPSAEATDRGILKRQPPHPSRMNETKGRASGTRTAGGSAALTESPFGIIPPLARDVVATGGDGLQSQRVYSAEGASLKGG